MLINVGGLLRITCDRPKVVLGVTIHLLNELDIGTVYTLTPLLKNA